MRRSFASLSKPLARLDPAYGSSTDLRGYRVASGPLQAKPGAASTRGALIRERSTVDPASKRRPPSAHPVRRASFGNVRIRPIADIRLAAAAGGNSAVRMGRAACQSAGRRRRALAHLPPGPMRFRGPRQGNGLPTLQEGLPRDWKWFAAFRYKRRRVALFP